MELVLFLPKCLRGFPREAILAFSVEGFSATNFLSGYEAVQFIPCLRHSAAAAWSVAHAIRCDFRPLAPAPASGVQFESGLYLVCLGNFWRRAWPQRPCALVPATVPAVRRGCPSLSAPSPPCGSGWTHTVGLTCLLSARSSVFR